MSDLAERARCALADGNVHAALTFLDEYLATRGAPHNCTENSDRIERLHYREKVNKIAILILEEWKGGVYSKGTHELYEAIESSCSMTYAHEAIDVLKYSNNDQAQPLDWALHAEAALRTDVEELLSGMDVEIGDDPPQHPVEWCTSCSEWRPAENMIGEECDSCYIPDEEAPATG